MSIELHVEPRKTYSWEEFQEEKPPYSIALDGLVSDATKREPAGPYANFDHHARADRTSTRATCAQVHMEINLGLFQTFREDGIPTANVYVNDADEDTCLAYWLLDHHELVTDHSQPRINRLVNLEDMLDATAGAYPLGDTKMRRQMAWIFEPYNNARFEGRLHTMEASDMKSIIEAVNGRIGNYVFEEAEEIEIEGQFERVKDGEGWVMVREKGPASRMAMYDAGVDAFTAIVSENDSYTYVLGRRSVWTPFDIPNLYSVLNKAEEDIVDENNRWGGSNTIGGSPRKTGSKLSPDEIFEIISENA